MAKRDTCPRRARSGAGSPGSGAIVLKGATSALGGPIVSQPSIPPELVRPGGNHALVRFAPVRFAPERSAACRSALVRSASLRLALARTALTMFTPLRSALERSASVSLAPVSSRPGDAHQQGRCSKADVGEVCFLEMRLG